MEKKMLTKTYNPFDIAWSHLVGPFFETEKNNQESILIPKTDVVEKEEHYLLAIELPGVAKKDININVKDGILEVKAKTSKYKEKDSYLQRERSQGEFIRSWNIEEVEVSKISAESKEGVLILILPKKKEVLQKKEVKNIEIK